MTSKHTNIGIKSTNSYFTSFIVLLLMLLLPTTYLQAQYAQLCPISQEDKPGLKNSISAGDFILRYNSIAKIAIEKLGCSDRVALHIKGAVITGNKVIINNLSERIAMYLYPNDNKRYPGSFWSFHIPKAFTGRSNNYKIAIGCSTKNHPYLLFITELEDSNKYLIGSHANNTRKTNHQYHQMISFIEE